MIKININKLKTIAFLTLATIPAMLTATSYTDIWRNLNYEKDKYQCLVGHVIRTALYRNRFLPACKSDWITHENTPISSIKPLITWIGHATFLIQIGGINILTDPIFGDNSFFHPRRLEPGIAIKNLPRIDFILISHNHIDHLNKDTLTQIKKLGHDPVVLVPFGDKNLINSLGLRARQLKWDATKKFTITLNNNTEKISFTFLACDHWSQRRRLFYPNKSLWGSWMITYKNTNIYFAGDTSYTQKHFTHVANLFPSIDVALVPIAPAEPRTWMKHVHLNADEAGQMFLDINAKHLIPMHWGTFSFGEEEFDAPVISLRKWWGKNANQLIDKQLHILKVGQQFKLPEINTTRCS